MFLRFNLIKNRIVFEINLYRIKEHLKINILAFISAKMVAKQGSFLLRSTSVPWECERSMRGPQVAGEDDEQFFNGIFVNKLKGHIGHFLNVYVSIKIFVEKISHQFNS